MWHLSVKPGSSALLGAPMALAGAPYTVTVPAPPRDVATPHRRLLAASAAVLARTRERTRTRERLPEPHGHLPRADGEFLETALMSREMDRL